jgi:hypothetical protein
MPSSNTYSNVNSMGKRAVLGKCRTTGNLPCAASILIPELTPVGSTEQQCVTVDSVSLTQKTSYDPYEYQFIFSSSNPYNDPEYPNYKPPIYITLSVADSSQYVSGTFNFEYSVGDGVEPSSGFTLLSASSITTYNSSYNSYAINSGTYNVSFYTPGANSVPMCNSLYFSDANWNDDGTPIQTITITTSS